MPKTTKTKTPPQAPAETAATAWAKCVHTGEALATLSSELPAGDVRRRVEDLHALTRVVARELSEIQNELAAEGARHE